MKKIGGYLLLILIILLVLVLSSCTNSNSNIPSTDNAKGNDGSISGSDDYSNAPQEKTSAAQGCCSPMCQPSSRDECVTFGGKWSDAICSEVEECKIGCCTPMCETSSKAYCERVGGGFTEGSCNNVAECSKSCCMPYCKESTKVECEKTGGTPSNSNCNDVEGCTKVCCKPMNKLMTKTECEYSKGTAADGSDCSNAGGTITIKTLDDNSCDCKDPNDQEETSCHITNGIKQTFTATYKKADAKDLKSTDKRSSSGKQYFFKGTGTWGISGKSEKSSTHSGYVTCYNTFPTTRKPYSSQATDYYKYSDSKPIETELVIVETDEGYSFGYTLPWINTVFQRGMDKSGSSTCGSESESETSSRSDSDDIETDDLYLPTGFFSKTLSGTKELELYSPEAFHCEGKESGKTTITFDFKLG